MARENVRNKETGEKRQRIRQSNTLKEREELSTIQAI
jgi:hypothetical protein